MIRIMIALQGRLYSEGLKSLINGAGSGLEVAGVADESDHPYQVAERLRPEVILTDTKTISAAFKDGAPDGAKLIVIGSDGEDLADLILDGIVCGALHDSSAPRTLETAVKAVSMGVVWMEGAWPKKRKPERAFPENNPGPVPA
jgi:DNA-binding NarL/FixJ family response regulator